MLLERPLNSGRMTPSGLRIASAFARCRYEPATSPFRASREGEGARPLNKVHAS